MDERIGVMTRYPIILVHGLALRQSKAIRAFGKIENVLREGGYTVFVADIDAFGSIENNAQQLKDFVLGVLTETEAEKVNIIAHSKGGLDSKYMITALGMEDKVASLTTLCTPHRGSIIASWIWALPRWLKRYLAFIINCFYKLVGDKNPDAMRACEQLKHVDESADTLCFSDKVYCQSYSTNLRRGRDCFLMGLPMTLYKHYERVDNDGMVSDESSKFGNYRGECLDMSVSHLQIVDFMAKKSQRERIFGFYVGLCRELCEMGY